MSEVKPIYIKFEKKSDYKLIRISFEIEANDFGVKTIIKTLANFLTFKTTWNFKNLKSKVL